MSSLYRLLMSGTSSSPVRRTTHVIYMPDPDTGQLGAQPVKDELVLLSKNGSMDKIAGIHRGVYHCGCDIGIPFGGRCEICKMHSCARCYGRCCSCQQPLCLEHSRFIEIAPGRNDRFCPKCADAHKRRLIGRSIVRGLLSPFVNFESKSCGGSR